MLEEAAERTWAAVERARAEDALRENEEQHAFLLKLSDRIRKLESWEEMGRLCVQLMAEEMDLDRCYFVKFYPEEDQALVGPEYHRSNLDPVSGDYPYSAFPEAMKQIEAETPVYNDVANDTTLPEAEKKALMKLDFGAWIGVPVRTKEKKVDGALYAVTAEPHQWTSNEVALVEEAAKRTWETMERIHAETALRESEERYRTLFESMDERFCIVEMLFDADEKAYDCRFLEVNPALEKDMSVEGALGKTVRDITPNLGEQLFEPYGRVALTGEPIRFEQFIGALDHFFDVFAFRIGAPCERHVAILFSDITERKREEQLEKEQNKLLERVAAGDSLER
jgi:PAS domain-containing protein